jgi:hypothetical protein
MDPPGPVTEFPLRFSYFEVWNPVTFFKNRNNNTMIRFTVVYNLTPNGTQYYIKVILAILSQNFKVDTLILSSTSW